MEKVQFSEPLWFLTIVGLNPHHNDLFSTIRKLFTCTIWFSVTCTAVLELVLNLNKATIIRASEVLFPYYQMLWKLIVLVKHKKKLASLLKASENFWPLDKFGKDQGLNDFKNHEFLRKCYRIYRVISYFSAFQYTIASFLNEQPSLLSYGETEGVSPKLRLFYIFLDNIFLAVFMTFVSGSDGLFFYIIGHVLSELRMVKTAFGQTKIPNFWNHSKRFRIALRHHSFVLNFVAQLDEIYSAMLLNMQFSYLFGLCFGSYLLIEDGVPPDCEHLTKYLPYIMSFLAQTWMCCLAGDLISFWSLEISNEIFYEDWSKDRAYQMTSEKIVAIKRAQKPASLTLGGFQNLDLRSFTMVVKNAGSFFTFVNTMTNK